MSLLSLLFLVSAAFSQPLPRAVRIRGTSFILSSTNATVILAGPNVVVKGPPYLPTVAGTSPCSDTVNDECTATGTCSSCSTFNTADIANLKARGWNAIRLGVVWAGAQPRDEDALDPEFLARLHAVLDLTDAAGIHVVLDNHGDMVAGQACGNGAPAWVSRAAAPQLIGKPLATGFPYSLIPSLEISTLDGYAACGSNASKWAAHAGDDNYNLLNECCIALNAGGNPAQLGWTTASQAVMDFIISPGPGRDAFVRYWRLLAAAVALHPSAFAAELSNEPMTIRRPRGQHLATGLCRMPRLGPAFWAGRAATLRTPAPNKISIAFTKKRSSSQSHLTFTR